MPDLPYLSVDGRGDPDAEPFAEAVRAMYPVAYALTSASRQVPCRDHALEGLRWAGDLASFTAARDTTRWNWTVITVVPDRRDQDASAAAVARVAAGRCPGRLADVRLEPLSEGCVQTLHVGSFDDEAGVLARTHDEFVPANRLRLTGRHHEIYLSDVRRVSPERRRTLLRQPVVAAGSDDRKGHSVEGACADLT